MSKVQIIKERKQITYADHWHASKILLERGIQDPKGYYYHFLSSIVFTAFTLEAFVNHIGENIFTSWDDLEKLSPKGKINIICDKLGIKVDYGILPWQIIPEIIGIRNKIAHGRNRLLKEETIIPHNDAYEEVRHKFLLADWQKYATQENAERARAEIEKVLKIIFNKAGIEDENLFNFGMQVGEVRFIEK
jgi:hypothetical protein